MYQRILFKKVLLFLMEKYGKRLDFGCIGKRDAVCDR